MSLVGDIILELRSRIPDAPGGLYPPGLISLTSTNVPGGGATPGVQHNMVATVTTPWGETNPGELPMSVVVNPGDNAIIAQVTYNTPPTQPINNINIYETVGASVPPSAIFQTADFWSFPAQQGIANYVCGVTTPTVGNAPSRSTAFNPDSDGNFIGGFMAYRLLNRAISEMVKIAGGIIDVTGVQSQINQSMYRIDTPNGQGSFYQFTNAWYDGYPMDVVQRSMMYLRNSAAGFSGILSYEQDGPNSVIQVWPQSNRTGGQNFLEAPLSATANSFLVSDGTGFLSIGLAQIDEEIVVYSQITAGGTVFSGVTRGMGGTTPAPHNRFAPVTELNIRLSGYRMPPIYQVGQSAQTLMVPQAWETPLVLHMLSQVRSMEQDDAAAKSLQGDFVQMAEKIAKGSRLGKLKPRQIPIWGQNASDARNVNGIGFGWLIN